jgi:hypothetical protein
MPNVFVQSCSGEKSKILCLAALKFTFQGENGNVVSFIHNILITDFVQHALLVGRVSMVLKQNRWKQICTFTYLTTQKVLMIHKMIYKVRMLRTFP